MGAAKDTENTIIKKYHKNSLTPFELDITQALHYKKANGDLLTFQLLETNAKVLSTTLEKLQVPERDGMTIIEFTCKVKINDNEHTLTRVFPKQESFYEPWEIDGIHIWFDAVKKLEDLLLESHGKCFPEREARFAIQDIGHSICPEKLHAWCPLPEGSLKIEECYRGEDCWMGPYDGADAHGGLDINHPNGTPLHVPFNLDNQFYFNSVAMGNNNNRWRGIRRWDNGSEWIIHSNHLTELLVEERTPLKKGHHYAKTAGTWVGKHEHTHFNFNIHEDGETYLLDPWILFWQMYQDQK